MKKLTLTLACTVFFAFAYSQTLITQIESVDSVITWPWNWDIATDGSRLVTVNENGTLNINDGSGWEIIEVDSMNSEPRGVAIAEDGTIWFTTLEHGLWSYRPEDGLINYLSENSFLPVNELRRLAIKDSVIWMSTDGKGLIRHDFNSDETTYYTKDTETDLKSDFNLDPYIDQSDNMWFSNRECLSTITPNLEWTNEDMRFHIPGGNVNDIHIESDNEIWLAMNSGLVLYDGTDYNVVIQEQFNNYIQVLKDSRGDLWLSRTSTLSGDGITVIHDDQTYFFSKEDHPDLPSQVFGFVEHQDTVVAVGTIGNNIVKLVFDFTSSTLDAYDPGISIFPNPASQWITVKSDEGIIQDWSLFDVSGRKVAQGKIAHDGIDVSNLKDGQYILSMNVNEQIVSRPVTVINQ